jgi:hypothetical protein
MRYLSLRLPRVAVTVFLLIGTAGCGQSLYPVQGKVTYPDGAPITKGMVVFESKDGERPILVRGSIQPDGAYQLGMLQPGDGVPPGVYRALIAPQVDLADADRPASQRTPPLFDARYAEFRTSGLEFEVKAGHNDIPITIDRPTMMRR